MSAKENTWAIYSIRLNSTGKPITGNEDQCYWNRRICGWSDGRFRSRERAHAMISEVVKRNGGHFHWDITPPEGYDFVISINGNLSAVVARAGLAEVKAA